MRLAPPRFAAVAPAAARRGVTAFFEAAFFGAALFEATFFGAAFFGAAFRAVRRPAAARGTPVACAASFAPARGFFFAAGPRFAGVCVAPVAFAPVRRPWLARPSLVLDVRLVFSLFCMTPSLGDFDSVRGVSG
jgi:hypothetical protein